MKSIFMDTNVVLDLLSKRKPFSADAGYLFDMALNGKIQIYVSAVSYGTVHYILKKSFTNDVTIDMLTELFDMTKITDVTGAIIKSSLKAGFKDYEDAIQYYCALSVPDVSFIVTRNTKDFKKSKLPVLTPSEALISLAIS